MEEKIPIYKSEEFISLPFDGDYEDFEETRTSQGFSKEILFSDYFHNLSTISIPYAEIVVYTMKQSEKFRYLKVCGLWDHNAEIFSFACLNENDFIELIEKYTNIIKNMSQFEKNIVFCLKSQ